MDKETLKLQLFRMKAAELPGLVATLAVLAANLPKPIEGFDIANNILQFCIQELAICEGRVRAHTEDFDDLEEILANAEAAGKAKGNKGDGN